MINYAKLELPVNIPAIQQQVTALASTGWHNHLNTRDYSGEWTVLPLRSPGGFANNTSPDLMGHHTAFLATPLMDECPAVAQMLDTLKCEVMSARLLNLKPGSAIKPHRDAELSFENGQARLHFPLFTNPQVEFYVEDDCLAMLPGQCWYINANLTHSAGNYGSTNRIHLVVDCVVNEWLSALFETAEKKETATRIDTTDWDKIIPALYAMGTPGAISAAQDMEGKLKAMQAAQI